MGMNAVCHTLNPRLFEADLTYIINHAEVGLTFVQAACMLRKPAGF